MKRLPLLLLANGLGTRMQTKGPKTLICLHSGETILDRLFNEIIAANVISELYIIVREASQTIQKKVAALHLPAEIIVDEPHGYFKDLVAFKHRLGLRDFFVVDSDLVVPSGELTAFLRRAAHAPAWLSIGITSHPEQSAGRPAWVTVDASRRITKLSRVQRYAYRTLGAFYWSEQSLTMPSSSIAADDSIMAYIANNVSKESLLSHEFSKAVNVNTKNDIVAANELIQI